MSTTARLWSISGLGVELDMDRRTVSARLRGVPPDGILRGNRAWRLASVLRALGNGHAEPAPPPSPGPPPIGAEILAAIPSSEHGALTLGFLSCIYKLPHLARALGPRVGCTDKQSAELATLMTVGMVSHAERELRQVGVAPFLEEESPAWLNMSCLQGWPIDEVA